MPKKEVRVKSFMRSFDPEQRKEICRNAANVRWANHRKRVASHRRSKPRRS